MGQRLPIILLARRVHWKEQKRPRKVDIVLRMPDGEVLRERVKAPVSSKSGAKYWGEEREMHLLRKGRPKISAAPTVEEFAPRFIERYARANRQKPSSIFAKEALLRLHLLPRLGKKRLDAITNEDVQRIKSELEDRSVKTVNNVFTVINKLLKVALKWNAIERLPVQIELLRVPPSSLPFYEDFQYERLVEAAQKIDWRILAVVLLGGDAGLGCGEMIALEWSDIDFRGGSIHVQRSDWRGYVTVPKGGRDRRVPMTKRLATLLKANRQLGGGRILRWDRDEKFNRAVIWYWMRKAQSRADLKDTGGVHILRHTFCSRLAIRGAPAKAIQELAGHANLGTTQRYMHLSPAAKDAAIALLDAEVVRTGDILETGSGSQCNLQ